MSEIQMLAGSLSNDLFRVASLAQRGSKKAAARFKEESKRWSISLQNHKVPQYIKNIASDVSSDEGVTTLEMAEKYLMYAVLLQNFSLSLIKSSDKVR